MISELSVLDAAVDWNVSGGMYSKCKKVVKNQNMLVEIFYTVQFFTERIKMRFAQIATLEWTTVMILLVSFSSLHTAFTTS